MNTAVINIKTNLQTKKQAQKIVEDMGLSLSGVINGFLKHLVKTKEVHFSLREEPTPYMIQALKESRSDIESGKVISFQNQEDELSYLNKLIAKDVKRSSIKKGSAQSKIFKKL